MRNDSKIRRENASRTLILVAEDDISSYMYFEVLLKEAGFDILHAMNGEEAISMCRGNPDISLVLMDLKMPFMDGCEAAKRIREFRQDLPIIAQTAYAFNEDREKALAAGCTDYISKPIDDRLLMKKICALVQGGRDPEGFPERGT